MKNILLLCLWTSSVVSYGQTVVSSVGGNSSGSTGSVSYTIGEVAIQYDLSDGSLSEGVQQPYEFFQVLSISNTEDLISFEVFPNPTTGLVQLLSEKVISGAVEVFDASGRLVYNQDLTAVNSALIDLTVYAHGQYLIHVREGKAIQTIKIIKN